MPLNKSIPYEKREILIDDSSRKITESGKKYLDRKFPQWIAEGKADEKYKGMDPIAQEYVDSRFHWQVFNSGSQNNKKHIDWKGQRVKIPKIGYNAGGRHEDYTPEKVQSTLDFLYFHISKRTNEAFAEIRDEMEEEKHPKRLLKIAAKKAVRDNGNGLLEDIQPLLKLMNIKLNLENKV